MRRGARWGAAPALAAAAAVLLAGCTSSAVSVPLPSPTGSAALGRTCAALHAALPASVLGGSRRETDPAGDRTAAWGDDPTVTLTCGGAEPARASRSADAVRINGSVCWLPLPDADGGFDLYPIGRTVSVDLHVPRTTKNPVDAATELTAAIARTVPATAERVCTDS